ncbi:MAG TPA: hypothetical protein PLG67_02755 [Bacillota bacterium]|nr:hypothetical protein [Bacillota bacterium]HPD00533.1 hypothetical protein [Acetivibrio sp.]HQJ36742.1 hypothetical protein [Bacillota bacterium]HQL35496.1 hypothetical protein [Bacillota bacterium]HRS20627.1 hypothetical protein [Clostridia bacterium]
MMKNVKILAIILAAVMLFTITGCSKDVNNSDEEEAAEAAVIDEDIDIPKDPDHAPVSRLEEEGGSIGLTATNYNITNWVKDDKKVKMLKKLNKQKKYVTSEHNFIYKNYLYDMYDFVAAVPEVIKRINLDNPQEAETINITGLMQADGRHGSVYDWIFHDGYVYLTNLGYEKPEDQHEDKYCVFVHRLNPENGKVDMDYYKVEVRYVVKNYIPDIINDKLNITGLCQDIRDGLLT